jgi:DNA-binding transcriptional ArsR family regulator
MPGAPRAREPDVFQALADPTRRHLVETLAARESASLRELATDLPMTRQAVSKHLAALEEAGLVASERRGRETRFRLEPGPLDGAAAWMTAIGTQWDGRLARLRERLEDRRS